MKIVMDNNVVIDALCSKKPFDLEANALFRAFAERLFKPYVTVNSLTDIFYVIQRYEKIGGVKTKAIIMQIVNLFELIPLTTIDCVNALAMPIDDFEDAILVTCAKKIGADYIVSRDNELITAKTEIKVLTPKQLLLKLKSRSPSSAPGSDSSG